MYVSPPLHCGGGGGSGGSALLSHSTSALVSTYMCDHCQAGKPSHYVTSHQGQLSLAIPWG